MVLFPKPIHLNPILVFSLDEENAIEDLVSTFVKIESDGHWMWFLQRYKTAGLFSSASETAISLSFISIREKLG